MWIDNEKLLGFVYKLLLFKTGVRASEICEDSCGANSLTSVADQCPACDITVVMGL